jgi:hypothetical protein
MKTLTIQILDQKAMDLIKEMENQHLLKINKSQQSKSTIDWVTKYKGSMSVESLEQTDQQLEELRGAWE